MDLLNMVQETSWREMLVELVASEKINPWDVNLCEVAVKYLEKVREMQSLDLRVPANVILASALLLKFKSDTISFEEDAPEEEFVQSQLIEEELPELVYSPNASRKRRVSLQELMNAVEQVMRQGKRVLKIDAGNFPGFLELELPKQDLHEKIKNVYEKALTLKDSENLLLFSALVNHSRKELNGHATDFTEAELMLSHLIPVLHLAQENKLEAWQDDFFGEIFIKILEEEQSKEAKEN